MYNVEQLGQVFTPFSIVSQMLALRKNNGRVLEPSCGNGAFFHQIPSCIGIEIDSNHCPEGALNMDFFDYPLSEKFDTIIGNPPYVRYQDINTQTKEKLNSSLFDERSNLYLFFIEKCLKHLNTKGELIFITPRDFLKATSSIKLNQYLFSLGTITDIIDLGDSRIFKGFNPNCIIFRFEKDNFTRRTNVYKEFVCSNGQLFFTDNNYPFAFSDIFFVKVGAVSGNDKIFESEEFGNKDFVCSFTYKTGKTRRMIFNEKNDYLFQFKEELLNRRIKHFDESNWWQWGRNHYISNEKRIYVNTKTRNKKPFFLHPCKDYDGSVLAIFPKNQNADLEDMCRELNNVNWEELGFVCDGRYLFSQKSLQNTLLPETFRKFYE
ncbi:MAG: class I SAM-dependent methyltransferase [Bacteroidales bacterium]|nr:class I SAM-dependent methyltransferase [Bacteroidales bacterium]